MSPTVDLSTLPPLDVAPRLGRLRALLAEAGCRALLVTKLENVRYLTGFSGSAAMLAVTADGAVLTTDGRYHEQAVAQLEAAGVEVDLVVARPQEQLEAIVKLVGASAPVGLEAGAITWAGKSRLAEAIGGKPVPTYGLVERLRVVKDEGELARIEAACGIADVALAQVKERLGEGVTETEFAAELEFEMRRRGASGPAFETIVGSGPNGAMPHARPTDREVREGDLVVVDFGATLDGYRSDMTRTLSIGEPSSELAELLDAVLASQRAGVRAVSAGATGGEVDAAARTSLVESGFGDAFVHSTGHGVGLEIHEAPAVSPGATDILTPGTIVTVEPGAYLPGHAGVRIEDTVVVTDSGCRLLTKSTKDYLL